MNHYFTITVIAALLTFIKADTLWLQRNITCVEIYSSSLGRQKCRRWNETTKMYYYMNIVHLCFPQKTKIETDRGPLALEELEVEDRILTLNG
jgi:hypothetical protein